MENLNNIDRSFCISNSSQESKLNYTLSYYDSSLLGEHQSSKLFPNQDLDQNQKSSLYSHYQIWKRLSTSRRDQYYFVFEGRDKLSPGFTTVWNNFVSRNMPKDFSICMVGDYDTESIPKEDYDLENNFFSRIKNKTPSFEIESSCYIISKSAANLVVQFVELHGFSLNASNFLFNFFTHNSFFENPQSILFLNKPYREKTSHSSTFIYGENDLLDQRMKIIDSKNDFESILKKESFDLWLSRKGLQKIEHYPKAPPETFSCYNPGNRIAIVTMYTKESASYGYQCELNLINYCLKHNYTLYVYRDSIDKSSFPSWSKPEALLNHINDHEIISWMDSDTLIFNPSKKIEWIVDNTTQYKEFIFSEDIGGHDYINSGVFFCRNKKHTIKILEKWKNSKESMDTSSLHSSGGDQKILGEIIKGIDIFKYFHKVYPMSEFNTDPRFTNWDTFIIHFMSYPKHLKDYFMNYWNLKFPIYK